MIPQELEKNQESETAKQIMVPEEFQTQNQESEKAKQIMVPEELQTQDQESETAKQDHNLLVRNQKLEKKFRQAQSAGYAMNLTLRKKKEEWVITVRAKIQEAWRANILAGKDEICIYKVPVYLYEKDQKSYFPQTVSIGPYHYGKEHLKAMECHKWRAVSKVLQRTNQRVERYLDAMEHVEYTCRSYEVSINLMSNKFTEMLVVDGCFVLELLEGTALGFSKLGYAPNDPVFAIGGLMHSIRRDMLMLENQVPFSVLRKLAELQNRGLDVRRLADHFFDPLMPTSKSFTNTPYNEQSRTGRGRSVPQEQDLEDEMHCLNLFRHRLLKGISGARNISRRGELPMVADKRQQRMIRCVTELRDAGFKFRKRETDSFWDIQFNEGFLEIPKLLINDGTKSLFLNLIAYEQRHFYSSNYITSYIIFMDNLIDTAEDVHYLHRCGIIEHCLGSNSEVANMFNGLCHEVVFNTGDVYLSTLLKEVDRCYKQTYFRKWNAWKRTLKHKYFDNPWAYLSFFAAVILLFLTFGQCYFAAYDYLKSGS